MPNNTNEIVWPKPIDVDDFGEGMFHVDFMREQFRDLTRPNMFKIFIDSPIEEWNNNLTTVLAKSGNIPSTEIGSYDFDVCGKTLHLPTNKMTFGDLAFTFMSDDAFELRTLFLKWQKFIHDWENNISNVPILSLLGRLVIHQYNTRQQLVQSFVATMCWPKVVGEISLSQDSVNTVEEFNVSFAYTDIEIYTGKPS